MEQGYRSGAGKSGCEGVLGDARRSCLWQGKRGHAEVHLAVRSGRPVGPGAAQRAIRQAEVGAARTMIGRTEARFGLKPSWLAADTAYGSAPNLDRRGHEEGKPPGR